jgi:glycosyltransferase involved in cell wall biosynthesis
MRIFLLSDINSAHTQKWLTALDAEGVTLAIFTLTAPLPKGYQAQLVRTIVYDGLAQNDSNVFSAGLAQKLRYLRALPYLRKAIADFQPDIVHAHYATSYGLLGAMTRFRPYIVSVWGSDVYTFPNDFFINKYILKYNLNCADVICSTSKAMRTETQKYTQKAIEITPFGIDTDFFEPLKINRIYDKSDIVIGLIKRMDDTYGIDYLIRAFALLTQQLPERSLRLLLVGGGIHQAKYEQLCHDLDIKERVSFPGLVPYEDVPQWQNQLDIYVSPSNSESFGVSALEAMACEKPVVVTNVGGLPEVVVENITGFIVPPRDVTLLAKAIKTLIENPDLAEKMRKAGRIHVQKNYEWQGSVQTMIGIYKKFVRV